VTAYILVPLLDVDPSESASGETNHVSRTPFPV
jgi:hypothetical protein